MGLRSKFTRFNATIAIYGLVTLDNAPQLVENDPVTAENDHFDDRVLTEQQRPAQKGYNVGVLGPHPVTRPSFLRPLLLREHPAVKVIVLRGYWIVLGKLWRIFECDVAINRNGGI